MHVTSLQAPLVVLLQQHRSYQPCDCRIVGKDAYDVGATLDLRVKALQWSGAV